MSTRYNNGSHYENHQRAAELHDAAAHAHRAAGSHQQQDHLTAHEQSRQALEYSHEAHSKSHSTVRGLTIDASEQAKIAARAHQIWQTRGSQPGSPDEDWFRAVEDLRSS